MSDKTLRPSEPGRRITGPILPAPHLCYSTRSNLRAIDINMDSHAHSGANGNGRTTQPSGSAERGSDEMKSGVRQVRSAPHTRDQLISHQPADDEPELQRRRIKQAEEQLREAEQLNRCIIENSRDCIKILGMDGRLQFLNPGASEALECDAARLIGCYWPNFWDGRDREACLGAIAEAQAGRIGRFEGFCSTRNGTPKWWDVTVSPIQAVNGKVERLLAVSREVTEQRQVRDRLLMHSKVLECMAEGVVVTSEDGTILYTNPASDAMFGYGPGEQVGLHATIHNDQPPEQNRQFVNAVIDILKEKGAWEGEFHNIRKDGSRFVSRGRIRPLESEGRKYWVCVQEDITERKQAERQRDALYTLLAAVNRASSLPEIFDAALDGICRCQNADRASILLYDSDGVMRFKGWRRLSAEYRQAVEGHSPWKRDEPAPKPVLVSDVATLDLDPGLKSVIFAEGIRALAFIPIVYDRRLLGKFMLYYDEPHPFTPDEIRPAETIASQVAFALERQRSGEALEQLVGERTASLQDAIAQMEEFSYSISHDLRGPLRAMQGYCHILLEDAASELDTDNLSYLKRIATSAERLDRLVQDVLAYTRVSRIVIEMQPVATEQLIAEVLRNYTRDHRPIPEISIDRPLLDLVGHEPSLVQCLSNLIENAIKFVPPDTVPRIRIRTEPHGDVARLWIEDNGIGIHPDYQQKIFMIFERSPDAGRYPGTGVGLAIVKKAIHRMHGDVGVESEIGKGSRFWIQLPRARQ